MKKTIRTHTKTINTISGPKTEKLELIQYSTHYAISSLRDGAEYPQVNVGARNYIAKLWQEKTGKRF